VELQWQGFHCRASSEGTQEGTRNSKKCENTQLLWTHYSHLYHTAPSKGQIQSIPKDILIIYQDNFKDYYGPFATHTTFSITYTFNPNFIDIQHLQVLEGFGEETAKKIAQEHLKQPFKNLENLCNRVKHVKKNKLTCELAFFSFTRSNICLNL
jgi:hypothetical protein